MARRLRMAAASFLVAATGGTAAGEDEQTVLGYARTFTLMNEVASVCPGLLPTDAAYAREFAAAAREAGTRSFGATALADALSREGPRRRAEVKVTGALTWCENQRRYLREYGDTRTFP